MADNTELEAGAGGDLIRTLEDSDGVKWPSGVCAFAISIGTPDVLQLVTTSAGLPVQPQTGSTWAATQSGTWNVGTVTTITNAVAVQDGGNVLSVDDGGGSLTVDGTVDVASISGTVTVSVTGTVTVDTELPVAATLADNTANPSLSKIQVFPSWFDGSTWDRARGDSTNGLLVNLGSNNDVTVSGSLTAVASITTSVVPGTGATHLGKAESGAHASGDTGIMALAVVKNTAVATASVGEYGAIIQDNNGQLFVKCNDGQIVLPNTNTDKLGAGTQLYAIVDSDGHQQVDVLNTVTITGTVTIQDGGNVISVDDGGDSLTVDNAALSVTGGGVEASALRVTIASDSTGVLSIDDNGGAITVDNAGTFAVQAAQSGTWTVQPGNTANTTPWLVSLHDGTTKASVADLTNANPLHVALVDGNGDQITSFAGSNTQYTEGDTDASITGTAAMWEDGSDTLRAISMAKPLPVQPGTSVAFPVTDNSGSLTVDNAGTFAVQASSVIPGTGATNLGKAIDSVVGATDTGVGALAKRVDGLSELSQAENDWVPLQVNDSGALWVSIGSENIVEVSNTVGILISGNSATTHDDVVSTGTLQTILPTLLAKDFDGSALPNAVSAEGDAALIAGSLYGVQYMMLVNEDGSAVGTMNAAQSGTWNITDISGTVSLPTGAATSAKQDTIIGHVDGIEGLLTTIDGDTGTLAGAVDGTEMQVDVITMPTVTIQDGGNVISVDDGASSLTVDNGGTFAVQNAASASVTGQTPYFDADGDNTAQTIKGSAGRLYFLEVSNPNSSDAYIQLFDESGAITVGTTTPKLSLFVPAGDGTNDGAMDKFFDPPISFANSIKYACTTTATGSGDPSTGLVVNGGYA